MHIKQNSVLRTNQILRESIRSFFTHFHFYQKRQEKDILLLSSMRSGSTWLMEVLSREPKLNYINEPNGLRFVSRSSIKEITKDPEVYAKDILFSIPDDKKDKIAAYFTEPRLTRLSSPYNIFRKNYHLFVNRRVLKVNDFNPCIEFMLNLGFQNLYLLRHPVPTIISTAKTNIRFQVDAYLGSSAYREKYLNAEQYKAALAIVESGHPYKMRALSWTLSHLPLWQFFEKNGKDHNCLLVTYEEMQIDPNYMINKLAKYLNLKATDALLAGLAVPSASTSDERVSNASFSGQSKIVEWMKPKNAEIIKECFEIIDLFGIEFYNRQSPTIIPKYSQLTHQLSEKAI